MNLRNEKKFYQQFYKTKKKSRENFSDRKIDSSFIDHNNLK